MYKEYEFTCDCVLEYLRKSRSDDPALSVEEVLEKHENILNEYSMNHFGQLIPESNIYREVASSETIDGRPEMLRLLRAIESPRIQAVLVIEVQRLSRGDLEDAGRLIKLLRYTHTKVITPYKVYDLEDDFDRDAFERELKRGNEYLEYFKKIQARGRLESVREGNYIGSVPPYGYDKVFIQVGKKKCPTLKENRIQADVVRMIFDLYVNHDMGYTSICRRLDELGAAPPKGDYWSPAALKGMLENVHYIGKVRWNRRKNVSVIENQEVKVTRPKSKHGDYLIFDGKHDGIIPEELFNAARAKQGKNYRAKPDTKIKNPFTGILYCKCGHALIYREFKNTDGSVRSSPRLLCTNQVHCGTGSVEYQEIVDRTCHLIRKQIAFFRAKLTESMELNTAVLQRNLISNLESQLKTLESRELSLWEAQADPDPARRMPDYIFQRLNARLLQEKSDLMQRIQSAHDTMPPEPAFYEKKIILLQDALNAFTDDTCPVEKKHLSLIAVVDRMEYYREKPVRLTKEEAKNRGYDTVSQLRWYAPVFDLNIDFSI